MADRKAELERKKAKLAAIRAEKAARQKEREVADAQSAVRAAVTGIKRDERQEIDKNLAMTTVSKLNNKLYTKLLYNANSLGKRFTHKSTPRMVNPSSGLSVNNTSAVVTHHQLFAHKDSDANMVNYKSPQKND